MAELRRGERGRVVQIGSAGAVRQRLLDVGLVPDAVVELERVAPAGDPIWIKARGLQLALRRAEARSVTVARLAPARRR